MTAGRSCPLQYRYRPAVFAGAPAFATDCLYVAGGLYGNPEALDAVEARLAAEPGGARVVFNGDFHWFDVDADAFADVQRRVLAHGATAGNVEAELADASGAGCGCGYPDYVGDATVARSNAIMERLRGACPAAAPGALAELPLTRTVTVGGRRVGVLHGDPESLAGWGLAVEALPPPDRDLRAALGCGDEALTSPARLAAWFREAGVDVFAATHTCLPALAEVTVDGTCRAVINNGSAGMPNFRGTDYGLASRIATTCAADAVARLDLGGLYLELVPLRFDAAAWRRRFRGWWPADSPARVSYMARIDGEVAFTAAQVGRRIDGDAGPG